MDPNWHLWDLSRWNDALVDIVFIKRPDSSSEILRIDATTKLLVSAVKAHAEDADAVRQCFLRSFPKTSAVLSTLFDASRQTGKWSSKDFNLPFFAQLYLTILVASADEETFSIGNFRNRLQKVLGLSFDIGHMLGGLPGLWKAAARWTRDTRRERVRRLIFPDPENEVIIGHSKRLAFPGFNDQNKLAALLAEHHIDAETPEYRIVEVVGGARRRFSKQFGEEFDIFLQLLNRGDRASAVRSPFWGAIVEIDWDVRTKSSRQRNTEFELELDPRDPYTSSLMLLACRQCEPGELWSVQKLAFPIGEMKYEIVKKAPSQKSLVDNLELPAGRLLLEGTSINYWLLRGWIGFCRDDAERWVASSSLSDADMLWLLVRDDRWARVDRALRAAGRTPNYVLGGVLSEHWYLAGPFRNNPGLREILPLALGDPDSFAPRLCPPRIRLVNALRLPEGILLVPRCSPSVVAYDAARISWVRKTAGQNLEPQWLNETGDGPRGFAFDDADMGTLPPSGEIEFRAYDMENDEIDRTSIFFVTGCVSRGLRRPSDLTSFLKVGDFGQLTPADTSDTDIRQAWHQPSSGSGKGFHPIVYGDHQMPSATYIAIEEIPNSWRHCLEILTAIFSRRAYVAAAEFVELVAKIWKMSGAAAWMRVEDLVENGFVQHLQHRRWRGSVFVGQSPQGLITDNTSPITFRITGIMPASVRLMLTRTVAAHGGVCRLIASNDLELIGAIDILVDRRETVSDICAACGLGEFLCRVSHDFRFPSWMDLLTARSETRRQQIPIYGASKNSGSSHLPR